MAIETSNDLDFFFETDAFGVSVTFLTPNLGQVNGILDTEVNELDIGIDAVVPVFTCKTASLVGVVEGSVLMLNSKRYEVKNRLDDGTGVTDLQLFEYDALGPIDNFYRPDGVSVYFRPDGQSYYLRAS